MGRLTIEASVVLSNEERATLNEVVAKMPDTAHLRVLGEQAAGSATAVLTGHPRCGTMERFTIGPTTIERLLKLLGQDGP